ncbi:8395_t:CDS:2 [Ambispora leptoticha]|uniref:8395_t:CDS:1 n=1 Tax=Ambispora leptoticha TaxID=144679 RepID=A0A9N8Z7T6_9GLOM|nr:8395_t:CDS:2 [Ambispora leptoticha]
MNSVTRIARKITKSFLPKNEPEGVGAVVRRCIGGSKNYLDPFLMCDFATVSQPAGFPDHPHRGFETVTYILEGAIAHEDFAGHKGIIEAGDIQWMTAGRGIVHAEMPAPSASALQIWVNLASTEKMCEPAYQELSNDSIPRATPEEGITIKVIAGESHGIKSSVFTRTPTMIMDFSLAANKKVEQPVPKGWNGFVCVIEGSGFFGADRFLGKANHALFLDEENQGEYFSAETGDESVRFMLFAGKPLEEPIVHHGPFVMNTEQEMLQTFYDYEHYKNGFELAKNFRSSIFDGVPLKDLKQSKEVVA